MTGKFPGTSSSYDHMWRWGALTFTMEGDGLVFWGGYSNYDPDQVHPLVLHEGELRQVVRRLALLLRLRRGRSPEHLAASDGGRNKTVGTAYSSFTYSRARGRWTEA